MSDNHHPEGQSKFIQHHFDGAQHQFDSGKLGIWAFLIQEMLFFSALFVAYCVYRSNHREIFDYAHHYLDPKFGGINTAVLIISSLTAAWAVRAAQLGQKKLLVGLLAATIGCACIFMGIKYVEYSHKIHIGVVFGKHFNPSEAPDGTPIPHKEDSASTEAPKEVQEFQALADEKFALELDGKELEPEKKERYEQLAPVIAKMPPPNTGMFFTIYYAMTGLHGIHVLVGIGIFIWLLLRARRGDFTPDYIGPIDYAALYWHLVDLVWIFLFPLLYLID